MLYVQRERAFARPFCDVVATCLMQAVSCSSWALSATARSLPAQQKAPPQPARSRAVPAAPSVTTVAAAALLQSGRPPNRQHTASLHRRHPYDLIPQRLHLQINAYLSAR